ncbi:MAG: 30S ribosome-binding factor RbfA [Holosporaceae bacterium]|nr:30S ribosome-binding factor RbfA [Holosporaceae bacterium]
MRKTENHRSCRVATEIKRVLSEYLLREFFVSSEKINSHLISITDVTVSSCLQHAKIYFSYLSQNKEECLMFLQTYIPRFRHQIGRQIRLKFVPDLTFIVDNSYDYGNRMDALIRSQ